jgi:hypothetical protein
MAAINDLFNNSIVDFIYEQKNIIIGGIFVGFAIVSYFYKANILFKNIQKIDKIEKIINKIESMTELEKQIFEMSINYRVLKAEIRAEFDVINIRLDGIYEFVGTAKEEIKILKEDTAFIRASKKWKWVVGLALIGLITTINFSTIKAWLSKILPW